MDKNSLSLGLIETLGLTTAIAAADAMCKAADVSISGYKKVGSGLVTVYVRGEVGAVQVAVESGIAAANKVGKLIASSVIARPVSTVIDRLTTMSKKKKDTAPQQKKHTPPPAKAIKPANAVPPAAPVAKVKSTVKSTIKPKKVTPPKVSSQPVVKVVSPVVSLSGSSNVNKTLPDTNTPVAAPSQPDKKA